MTTENESKPAPKAPPVQKTPEFFIAVGKSVCCENGGILGSLQEIKLSNLNDDPKIAQASMDKLIKKGVVIKK